MMTLEGINNLSEMQKNELKKEIKEEFKKREFETKEVHEEEDEVENKKFI